MARSAVSSLRRFFMFVLVAAVGVLPAMAQSSPVSAADPPSPHWGLYRWSGGAESANIRGFWLFDRTGDPQLHEIISWVAKAWDSVVPDNPQMPYIAVYQDDAHAGQCFVNNTPGYSVASACSMFQNTDGVKAIAARNPDADGHLLGAAFAVASGLTKEETVTVVCHAFGHIMGLENSNDADSCMSHDSFEPGKVIWYNDADAVDIFGLYDHSDSGAATTTTTAPTATTTTAPTATTTTTPGTTTTTAPGATTTTTAPSGTTTTTAPPATTTTTALIPSVTTTTVTVPVTVVVH